MTATMVDRLLAAPPTRQDEQVAAVIFAALVATAVAGWVAGRWLTR